MWHRACLPVPITPKIEDSFLLIFLIARALITAVRIGPIKFPIIIPSNSPVVLLKTVFNCCFSMSLSGPLWNVSYTLKPITFSTSEEEPPIVKTRDPNCDATV